MEKINFKNKGEPGAIPANADNLNLMQNNIENSFKSSKTISDKDTYSCNYVNSLKPSIITIGLNEDTSFKNQNLIIPLTKIMSSSGSKFELVNNKIKIGEGVTKIKVSGSITEQSDYTQLFGGYIFKNGITLSDAINIGFSYIPTTNEMFKISLSPVVVDVAPGDLIGLVAYTQSGSATVKIQAYSGRATNLTIEEIIE